jgi:hypothetical protein
LERRELGRDVGQRERRPAAEAVAAAVEAVLAAVIHRQEHRPDRADEVLLSRLAGVDVGGRRAEVDGLAAGPAEQRRRQRGTPDERSSALPVQNVYLR